MNTATTKTEKNAAYHQKVKSNVVTIRLDDDSMTEFNALCATSKLGKSALMRSFLNHVTIKAPNTKATESVIRELRAIGNNINQITKIANSAHKEGMVNHGGLSARLKEFQEQLKQIEDKL